MEFTVLRGWLASSQDPTQIANKVKGLVLMASSMIVFFAAHWFNITLTPDNILALATDFGGLAGALWTIYGIILHVLTLIGSKKVVDTTVTPTAAVAAGTDKQVN